MARTRLLKIPKFLRPGGIDFTEPMTELIVPNGQAVRFDVQFARSHS
jgi:hypothetical protein